MEVLQFRMKISRKSIHVLFRNNESFVTQDTVLFHDSIKNRLLIARPSATDEEVAAACKKAYIHGFY